VPIESGLITKRIAAAQKAVEAQNFAARKHLLEYDDVMNKQRQAIYALRRSLLEGSDQKNTVFDFMKGIVGSFLGVRVPPDVRPDQWDLAGLQSDLLTQFGVDVSPASLSEMTRVEIEEAILERLTRRYEEKEALVGPEMMRETERIIMLNVIDNHWKDHLLAMDHLKEGIGLRGYGQKDPLVEYKRESFSLFEEMRDRIEDVICKYLFFLQASEPPPYDEEEPVDFDGPDGNGGEPVAVSAEHRHATQSVFEGFTRNIERKKQKELDAIQFVGPTAANPTKQALNKHKDVGRNDPCPCGSGKKYKKCCGA